MREINGRTDVNAPVRTEKMWCANNGCNCYDKLNDKCTRIGKDGTKGICWMNPSEGEY